MNCMTLEWNDNWFIDMKVHYDLICYQLQDMQNWLLFISVEIYKHN